MIGRGTTPTIGYILEDLEPSDIVVCYLTILNNGVRIERDITTMQIDENIISWELTQEETLTFTENTECDIQIRCRDMYGKAYDTPHFNERILGINKDGVI